MCGKTPLSTAASLGNSQILRLLLNPDEPKTELVKDDMHERPGKKWGTDDDKQNENTRHTLSGAKLNKPFEQQKNLGYYIFVHNDELASCEVLEDMNKNESLDAATPEGMDDLEWDVEMLDELERDEPDDVWSCQYRWYANILDKTGGLIEDSFKGCDVDLQDLSGRCAIHYAVENGQLEALQCLINAGTSRIVFV